MQYADDYILEILSKLPSECAYLDYKEIPYLKDHYHDLMKDVIAMLNSEEGIGFNKAIIFGISDNIPHNLKGIDSFLAGSSEKFDDASYQTVFDRITPRPHITVGTVVYQGRTYGYVFMDADLNRDWIYEVGETYVSNSPAKSAVSIGQAFTRRGSKNYVMLQADREHLKELCEIPSSIRQVQNWHPIAAGGMEPLLIAAILGGWNENNPNDRSLVELLSGIPYDDWIQALRKLYENKDPSISFDHNIWIIKSPETVLEAFGIQVYDSHLAKIELLMERAFSDYDTKYDLEPDDRFAASVYEKRPRYSASIRHGLSRFLAIAGNFPAEFPSCTSWKLKQLIVDTIKKVVGSPDWRIIATMEGNFQLLAEANPSYFAEAVQKALAIESNGLRAYLSESECLLGSTQFYGSQLICALTQIACKQEYFSHACFSAFCVLKVRSEHLETLTSVFLPWSPKTEAPFLQRIAMVKQFFDEDDALAWKFLCTLLPGQTTVCGAVEKPKYLACKMEDQTVTVDAYRKESDAYLALAIEKASSYKERLLTLAEFLDKAPKDIFHKILAAIEAACSTYTDDEKYVFWNKLQNLFCKHKQFPEADWALPNEALNAIASSAEKIAPKERRVRLRRLFQNSEHDILPEWFNSHVEHEAALSALRSEELDWCYQTYGLESLVDCMDSFDSVRSVGTLLARSSFTSECDERIYTWLSSSHDKHRALAKEYLQERFRTCGVPWLKAQLKGHSQEEIVMILGAIPLTSESMYLAEQLLTDRLDKFWRQVPIWGLDDTTKADYVIQKLLQYDRPLDAVELISAMHCTKQFLEGETIFETLKALVTTPHNNIAQYDAYTIVSLIEWLQENWEDERVTLLEWWYFKLFQPYDSKGPKRLYMALATDPNFFMEILCRAFKGRHEAKRELSDEEAKMGEHSFDVLYHWNVPPGTNADRTIDADKLHTWFSAVKEASQEKDRYAVAMQLVGASFFYSPPDPDGLFIHHSVAELLHKEGDELRDGYYNEAIKSRGAHFVDPSGAPEFALEKKYNEFAMQIDTLGFFRFAEKLRLLANFYHNEALENMEENRRWRELEGTT